MAKGPAPRTIDERARALLDSMVDAAETDDGELRDRLVQLTQVVNMAEAEAAKVMNELAERAGTPAYEFVADEIAITLSMSKPVASGQFTLALQACAYPPIMQAWQRGDIDARKVKAICDGLADASPLAIEVLADSAAQYASSHTPPELRRWLHRRVIMADPEAAEAQRQRTLADRRITCTPLGNGLSEFAALLPSVQARQIYETVNSVAQLATHDDVRTVDQRRSDAFVDLVMGRAEPPQVTLNVVVPADTLLRLGDAPATLAGVGPITPTQVRHLTADPVMRRMITDPVNGQLLEISEKRYRPSTSLERLVRARDMVCRFPGCSRPATTPRSGTDLDHTIPWPEGETKASNLAVLCRHHHRLKHSPGWSVTLGRDGVMQWTTPTGKSFQTTAWVYNDTG